MFREVKDDEGYTSYIAREKLSDGRTLEFGAYRTYYKNSYRYVYDIVVIICTKRRYQDNLLSSEKVTGVGIEGLSLAATILELFEEYILETGDNSNYHYITVKWTNNKRKRAYMRLMKYGYKIDSRYYFYKKIK